MKQRLQSARLQQSVLSFGPDQSQSAQRRDDALAIAPLVQRVHIGGDDLRIERVRLNYAALDVHNGQRSSGSVLWHATRFGIKAGFPLFGGNRTAFSDIRAR